MFDVYLYQLLYRKQMMVNVGCGCVSSLVGVSEVSQIKVLLERIITSSKRDGATFYTWG